MDLWEAVESSNIEPSKVAPSGTEQQSIEEAISNTAETEGISRETELLALIHDLNECNDALLSRVSQLEKDVEKAQAMSQSELERAQAAVQAIQARMSERISAEHASIQQVSQNAQQQVAKVVTQLETTEQALSRQQLINENLQTELDNSQERIAQLERDCALSAQKHAEEAKARVKAETTSRDLKTRLQRQQRYTLQFKAALEKSLTVSSRTASESTIAKTTRPISFKDTASVVMPRAQRIMPWASATSVSPFQGIDPHLETLIRSVGQPSEPKIAPPIAEIAEIAEATVNEPMAPKAKEMPAETIEVAIEKAIETSGPNMVQAPKLNWQTASKAAGTSSLETENLEAETLREPSSELPTEPQPESRPESQITPIDVEKSFAAATRERLETAANFTEPSPWGKPLPQPGEEVLPAVAQAGIAQSHSHYDYLPATEGTTDSTVAPVVNPLRTQKRIGSLASVELPTFPNAKVGSFRR